MNDRPIKTISAESLISRLRYVGGLLFMNLKDAATWNPDHFNTEALNQLLADWDEIYHALPCSEHSAAVFWQRWQESEGVTHHTIDDWPIRLIEAAWCAHPAPPAENGGAK